MWRKITPLRLSQREELTGWLAGREFTEDLSNRLFAAPLAANAQSNAPTPTPASVGSVGGGLPVGKGGRSASASGGVSGVGGGSGGRDNIAVSIATLLIRSKSVALVRSVFEHWPHLRLRYAVVDEAALRMQQSTRRPSHQPTITMLDLSAASHSSGSSGAGVSPSGRASPTHPSAATAEGETMRGSMVLGTALVGSGSAGVGGGSAADPEGGGVIYETRLAKEVSVGEVDFRSTRALRLLGFTLPQLRDSRLYDLKALLAAGFPLQEVRHLKGSMYVSISAKDLRLAGYSVHQVR